MEANKRLLKSFLIVLLTALTMISLYGSMVHASDSDYNYATIQFPDSNGTWVTGISGNKAVGYFQYRNSSAYHGFVFDGERYSILDFPGARSTYPYGISGDRIVGRYENLDGEHSFLYNGQRKNYVTLNFIVQGICGKDILGAQHANAVVYDGESFRILDDRPKTGIEGIAFQGISGKNIVGTYWVFNEYLNDGSNQYVNFVYDGKDYTSLAIPGVGVDDSTWANGVDGYKIVGAYEKGADLSSLEEYEHYGFLYDGRKYSIINFPGSEKTDAVGISGDNIVGTYQSGILTLGFIATPKNSLKSMPLPGLSLLLQ